MTKALSPTTQAAIKAIAKVERKVIRKAMRVVEQGALDARTIDDDGLPVEVLKPGDKPLSGKRLRVALDMRKPKRESPVYIDVLTRRLESAEKADAMSNQGSPVQLNVGTVNIVQAPQYDVIDVTPGRKE